MPLLAASNPPLLLLSVMSFICLVNFITSPLIWFAGLLKVTVNTRLTNVYLLIPWLIAKVKGDKAKIKKDSFRFMADAQQASLMFKSLIRGLVFRVS